MRVNPFFLKYRARLPAMNPPAPVMTMRSSFFSGASFSTVRGVRAHRHRHNALDRAPPGIDILDQCMDILDLDAHETTNTAPTPSGPEFFSADVAEARRFYLDLRPPSPHVPVLFYRVCDAGRWPGGGRRPDGVFFCGTNQGCRRHIAVHALRLRTLQQIAAECHVNGTPPVTQRRRGRDSFRRITVLYYRTVICRNESGPSPSCRGSRRSSRRCSLGARRSSSTRALRPDPRRTRAGRVRRLATPVRDGSASGAP